jgi:hypothetical protein
MGGKVGLAMHVLRTSTVSYCAARVIEKSQPVHQSRGEYWQTSACRRAPLSHVCTGTFAQVQEIETLDFVRILSVDCSGNWRRLSKLAVVSVAKLMRMLAHSCLQLCSRLWYLACTAYDGIFHFEMQKSAKEGGASPILIGRGIQAGPCGS